MVHFSGKARKMNLIPSRASEASVREECGFYSWLQNYAPIQDIVFFKRYFSKNGYAFRVLDTNNKTVKMKSIKITTLLLLIQVFAPFALAAQKTEWLKATTPVFAELKDKISSEDVKEGQRIEFTVTDQVVSDNNTPLIATGAMAYGRVKRLTEYEMEIEIQFVKSVTGKIIHLEGPPLKSKRSKRQCCIIFDQNTPITGRVKDNVSLLL
ncbi:MAG: hypothetical protein U5L45_00855 [Saprospiraceae bacterium]|nr:hypothetical protein [Saprospiraceae bacterium]